MNNTEYAICNVRTGYWYNTNTGEFTSKPIQTGDWHSIIDLFIADKRIDGSRKSGETRLLPITHGDDSHKEQWIKNWIAEYRKN